MESNQLQTPVDLPSTRQQVRDPGPETSQGTGRQKRNVNTPACLQCRARKRACDAKRPKCSQCEAPTASGIPRECTYPASVKRRGPGKSKQRMVALENRLRELESTLQQSHSPSPSPIMDLDHGEPSFDFSTFAPVDVGSTPTAATNRNTSPSRAPVSAPLIDLGNGYHPDAGPFFGGPVPRPDQPPPLMQARGSELSLLANSFEHIFAELPIFGSIRRFRMRMRRVVNAAGKGPFEFLGGGPPSVTTLNGSSSAVSATASSEAGPGTAAQTTITPSSFTHPARWAWLNAGVALALHARTANRAFASLAPFAWAYFNNAHSMVPQLVMPPAVSTPSPPPSTTATTRTGTGSSTCTRREKDDDDQSSSPVSRLTETVQSLIWMAQFLLGGSGDTRSALALLAAAGRLGQVALAIPQQQQQQQAGTINHVLIEEEDARRAVWAAAVLDAELSLCSGLVPSLSTGVLGEVDLPGREQDSGGTAANGREGNGIVVNADKTAAERSWARVFGWRAELVSIHAQVRTKLYSRDALAAVGSDSDRKKADELLRTVMELEQTLEEWRRKIPEGQRPGNGGPVVPVPGASQGLLEPHCVVLHLVFYSLSGMVHWAVRRYSAAAGDAAAAAVRRDLALPPAQPELYDMSLAMVDLSRRKNRTAAQLTLRLLRESPFEQFAHFWRNIRYPLSAAVTLLLHILERPADAEAAADAQLLAAFRRQVAQMQSEGDFPLSALVRACSALEGIAHVAVARAKNGGVLPMEVPGGLPCEREMLPYVLGTVQRLLRSCTHPMWLVQGLLTNLPNRDSEKSREFARVLGIPNPAGPDLFGPLVPECMKPGKFSSKVGSTEAVATP
ncbi:hypothetical protein VTJ49DRAFT_2931 [Mycothermus thermophilus]|uniref:Zn(2)-C6 fungal-type domain-containing protein n=1 Tax=Humicola insolens TaxID=85995 RepID=A0ABR3V8Y4_HUMIN